MESNTPTNYNYDQGMIQPLEQFSTEDNELLMSVLQSNPNPLQDQYPNYYPMPMWEFNFFDSYQMNDFELVNNPNQSNIDYQNKIDNQKLIHYSPNSESVTQENSSDSSNKTQKNSVKDKQKNEDKDNSIEAQKIKRRESQNRASRNYRQRKKAYIKEIEEELEKLRLENEQLRIENMKNRRVINQFRSIIEKPPLLRSYSTELQMVDEEIENIVAQLKILTYNGVREDDPELKKLLKSFHQHVSKRQKILQKDAFQLANPKMQEKLVRFEGFTSNHEIKITEWLKEASKFVTDDQIIKLNELKKRYFETMSKIIMERNNINSEIKAFYQNKIAMERMNYTGKIDPNLIQTLSEKLGKLKKNYAKESELANQTSAEFSSILTPYQEAIITINHYNYYKERTTTLHVLNSVWNFLSDQS